MEVGDVGGSVGGVWGILDWLGRFLREGLRLGFGIWVGMDFFDTGELFAVGKRNPDSQPDRKSVV